MFMFLFIIVIVVIRELYVRVGYLFVGVCLYFVRNVFWIGRFESFGVRFSFIVRFS